MLHLLINDNNDVKSEYSSNFALNIKAELTKISNEKV